MKAGQGCFLACAAALAGVAACSNSGEGIDERALPGGHLSCGQPDEEHDRLRCTRPSAFADDRGHMLVFGGHDITGSWIRSDGCADVAACGELRANRGVTSTFSYPVRQVSGDRLTGIWVTSEFIRAPTTAL